ncbi:ATP-dependent Clp protease ATP-binding subunit [Leuconostoc mesenteroides]|uniref:ATP-binding subunit of Clp protease and DnaK/DnaJ chaperones n=1 Tax=Leuconostoc mesenteroides subsp. mesenteroides (strain ATCC 8293 / DSM 20343 / BCRC 11652 / CCM 1803 / JCM 6124 / NCDO 523 / NBRC 100496 / NCIMB 8023 / NCTC 12954 / NRRL B-1118 / 37Y) TaxID=203120 RepID=Q03X61_LEUMM|nr:ATP-dependent Clp protease ATP-binding subunit [Leuconostoc mesenteroides]ABJ62211.1 ATP-binding subunit of Clp protease and DnaK/DnaJ chaperones [Leuconostoc mesenteroides subsp. mesenteroides ATCC 8293]MCT3043374.1 ATP-dependent Clp protease ATP-binding subunit [Leuconostoc mesenteroides]MDG9747081.1 ATP-dependent Clp protease ATP-binding subunit [Leuconostoc mesenteroides]QQB30998.1 ATP-dependent Clp protease ATP-binding subunit [Leuconostoc mesenteroides]STY37276.1 ATP-dependent Clp pro
MIELKQNNTTPYLDRYTTDISAKVMSAPEKYHAYERESITRRIMVSLMKQIQNAPLLVGLPGVGKTAIVEDLARQLLSTSVSSLKGKHLVQISLANLMKSSDGESFAHKFQAIIDELIANKDTVIAFIDEIHQIVGTGAETSGSSLDAGNIIKPALSRDDLQIIGATTTKEFHEYVARDGALMRRFDLIEVPELSFEQTKNVLSKVALQLNNGIEVPETVQDRIMALSQRYITDRYFPEKAIMLLDGALSVARLDNRPTLSNQDVATIIHDDYHVPEYVINQTTDERLLNLLPRLKSQVIGQDTALEKVAMKLTNREAGLADTSKPESFLFMGPTGVGKTETAKQLALNLFGNKQNFIRFDMSEFKFAGTSLERFKDQLTTRVRHTPYAVLLLDEIEKADPEVMDLLLQVLDDGRLSDEYGRVINFKDLIIVMTTNSGATAVMNRDAKSDAVKEDKKRQANFEEQLEIALQSDGYRPEFIARIGAIIVFDVLKMADMVRIVELKLSRLNQKAQESGFNIVFDTQEVARYIPSFDLGFEYLNGTQEVSSPIANYIADVGYKPSRGVRPIDDTIATYVSDPVSAAIIQKRQGLGQDFDTFIFRAIGNPPSLTSPYGEWQVVVSTAKEAADNEAI